MLLTYFCNACDVRGSLADCWSCKADLRTFGYYGTYDYNRTCDSTTVDGPHPTDAWMVAGSSML